MGTGSWFRPESSNLSPWFHSMMSPSNAGWKADSVRSSVDLPTPLHPSRHVNSPLLMAAFSPCATTFSFPFWLYPMLRFFSTTVSIVVAKIRTISEIPSNSTKKTHTELFHGYCANKVSNIDAVLSSIVVVLSNIDAVLTSIDAVLTLLAVFRPFRTY